MSVPKGYYNPPKILCQGISGEGNIFVSYGYGWRFFGGSFVKFLWAKNQGVSKTPWKHPVFYFILRQANPRKIHEYICMSTHICNPRIPPGRFLSP